jgi:cbb3-type cytochrome oxidase subunit 3
MKKLSYWAATNPWKARIIIVISHILILFLGWYTGTALNELEIFLPAAFLLVLFILLYLITVFVYPSKQEKQVLGSKKFYIKQKLCDFSLTACAWIMIVSLANNRNVRTGFFNYASASSIETAITKNAKPTAAEILESLKYRDKSTLTKEEKRILKKEFNVQLKKYVKAKITGNKKASDETGLIILSIVLALGLLYLVGALACTLSCNGSDAAAIVVALLGTAAIVIGLIFVIRGIKKKQSKGMGTKTATSS